MNCKILFIIRTLSSLLLLISLYLSLPWFDIILIISSIEIKLKTIIYLLLPIFFYFEYHKFNYKKYHEIFSFIYWLFFVICFVLLSISYIQTFILPIEYAQDYLFQNQIFACKLQYTQNTFFMFSMEYLRIFLEENKDLLISPINIQLLKKACIDQIIEFPLQSLEELKSKIPKTLTMLLLSLMMPVMPSISPLILFIIASIIIKSLPTLFLSVTAMGSLLGSKVYVILFKKQITMAILSLMIQQCHYDPLTGIYTAIMNPTFSTSADGLFVLATYFATHTFFTNDQLINLFFRYYFRS